MADGAHAAAPGRTGGGVMRPERRTHPKRAGVQQCLASRSTPADAAGQSPWAGRRGERGPGPYLAWAATPGSVGAAPEEIAQRARNAGASDAGVADIKLAVSEACTNAVLHAFVTPYRTAETFAVSTAANGESFAVWVTDGGRGAAPATPPLSGGMGLPLMAAVSRTLDVGTLVGGGTQVHMTFPIGVGSTPVTGLTRNLWPTTN